MVVSSNSIELCYREQAATPLNSVTANKQPPWLDCCSFHNGRFSCVLQACNHLTMMGMTRRKQRQVCALGAAAPAHLKQDLDAAVRWGLQVKHLPVCMVFTRA